jgi:hypothetical protein
VTCFGYLGYKNARFGRIEAHEAINAFGREKLLAAKELAERAGFRLLHAIVDSLWVVKPGATREDYERLTREVAAATDLPVDLAGVYKFIVFLPSRENPAVPVPNRYFGVFACANELKVRGLEVRRHDSPPIIARMQEEVLVILAEAHDAESYRAKLVEAEEVFTRYRQRLLEGKVSWEELIIRKRLTRHPRDYQRASHVAVAAQSLAARGVRLRPGEVIEYVITDADSAVPCDRARPFTLLSNFTGYDRKKYVELLQKALNLPVRGSCVESSYSWRRVRSISSRTAAAVLDFKQHRYICSVMGSSTRACGQLAVARVVSTPSATMCLPARIFSFFPPSSSPTVRLRLSEPVRSAPGRRGRRVRPSSPPAAAGQREARNLRQPAGDERGAGVVAEFEAVGNPGGDGDDILYRAANLDADDVGVGIQA